MTARETKEEKYLRMTELERPLWARGQSVAGIDEVGRGPLVGPVLTACVIPEQNAPIYGVDDSKKLTEKRREALYEQIIASARYAQTARVEAADIDRFGILSATREAMERSAEDARGAVFLVDAMEGLRLPGEAVSLIHGDALSYAIAAASIVAKVTRDRWMVELDARYPQYGFARNKGYGTKEHIEALRRFGPCPEHRLSFIRNFVGEARR